MIRSVRIFNISFLIILALCAQAQALGPIRPGLDMSSLEQIVVEDGGRLKPLDTYARESILAITGAARYEGFRPLDLVLSWIVFPEVWEKEPILWVGYRPLASEMGVDARRVSPETLVESTVFASEFQRAARRREAGEKLTAREKGVLNLFGRLTLLDNVRSGKGLVIVPASTAEGRWRSISELTDGPIRKEFLEVLTSYGADDSVTFARSTQSLSQALAQAGAQDISSRQVSIEVHYNQFKPFEKALISYAAAAIGLLLLSWIGKRAVLVGAVSLFAAGFLIHSWGIILRCLIAGRPPVSNMYESVIWVSWGVGLFAIILTAIYRNRYLLFAASLAAAVGLFMANLSPILLDPGINPLVPVLRNNMWLTIHVLTITLSYAAFALALALGHIYLFKCMTGGNMQDVHLKQLNLYLYRSLQVGIVLLAAGTILGGVWANYSWGRFWGWDPKEVWALIALLGYLALLHGRLAGWLKDFGLAIGAIVAFMGIVMAWYGVNFVLGVGLHSYGFGSGGIGWVLIYLIAEFVFVGTAAVMKTQRVGVR